VNELRQLKPVTGMYVKNSTDFCQQLNDVTLQRNEVLVSFEVISLFSTVPGEAAIEDMHQRWFQEINLDVNKLNLYILKWLNAVWEAHFSNFECCFERKIHSLTYSQEFGSLC
jgi:hypothetical protein